MANRPYKPRKRFSSGERAGPNTRGRRPDSGNQDRRGPPREQRGRDNSEGWGQPQRESRSSGGQQWERGGERPPSRGPRDDRGSQGGRGDRPPGGDRPPNFGRPRPPQRGDQDPRREARPPSGGRRWPGPKDKNRDQRPSREQYQQRQPFDNAPRGRDQGPARTERGGAPRQRHSDERRDPARRYKPDDRPNELRQIVATSWSDRGEAVMDGSPPVWVWGGIVGERCGVRTRRSGQNRQYVSFEGTSEPSEHRVEPPCYRYATCGSCPWMHMDAQGQAQARVGQVQRAFDQEKIQVTVQELVAGPQGLSDYRHVSKLVAGVSDRGNYRLGAPGRFTRRIVSIPSCNILTPTLRAVTLATTHAMIDLDVRPFVMGEGGLLRYVQSRQSHDTGEVIITLVGAYRARILDRMAESISSKVPDVVGVHLHVNEREDNNIFDRDEDGLIETHVIFGKSHIRERVGRAWVQVGPTDFFQTNPGLSQLLVEHVMEQAALDQGVPVVDLYCGVGGTTLNAAKITGWALGIEANTVAIKNARAAAQSQVIPAEFVNGRVEDVLASQHKRLSELRPVVLVNPARRGLEEGVGEAIRALRPRRIVYTSCSPKALARDLAGFVSEGWTVTSVRPFDMFPNTQHVEVVACLVPADVDEVVAKRAPRRRVVKRSE